MTWTTYFLSVIMELSSTFNLFGVVGLLSTCILLFVLAFGPMEPSVIKGYLKHTVMVTLVCALGSILIPSQEQLVRACDLVEKSCQPNGPAD